MHHTIIFLLRIYKLFVYCKSTNNFYTRNRLNILLLCIEKLYDNFKSPTWKHFNDLYVYCQRPIFWVLRNYYFATAHFPVICLLQIDHLFHQCKSSKYLLTVHRKIVSHLQIAYSEKFRPFMTTAQSKIFCLLRIIQLFCYCASPNYLSTANRPIISPLEIVYIFDYSA